ncbi:MAG: hypothetical protein PHU25_00590 [Deltaproteobacteria bacterium]|nr:hypothetical protein [Deltaproteobacteria bacterium]
MGVIALVLGILGLVVFDWLGFVLAGSFMIVGGAASAISGDVSVPVWPVVVFAWGMGVVLPLVSVVFGILAMRQPTGKGLGIAGLVIGGVATIIGVILALVLQFGASAGNEYIEQNKGQLDVLTKSMNDPATQKQIQQIQQALRQIPTAPPAALPPNPAPAPGAPPAPPPAAPPAAPPPPPAPPAQ